MSSVKSKLFEIARSSLVSISPALFDRIYYLAKLGRWGNFKSPELLSEKLIWLKANWRDPIAEICADKDLARTYVSEKGYSNLLIDVISIYEREEDFDFAALPDKFVLKATHGSGWNIVCHDKSALNEAEVRAKVKKWLSSNYYYQGAEYLYKNMTPKVICETMLEDEEHADLLDYKIMCFSGEPKFFSIYSNRYGDASNCCYDINWNRIPGVHASAWKMTSGEIPRPRQLDYMLEIARALSVGFPTVRIDLYEVSGKVYFGEMTFFHNAGFCSFSPFQYNKLFGDLLELPNSKLQK